MEGIEKTLKTINNRGSHTGDGSITHRDVTVTPSLRCRLSTFRGCLGHPWETGPRFGDHPAGGSGMVVPSVYEVRAWKSGDCELRLSRRLLESEPFVTFCVHR